jgi:hypothetical protein
MGREKLLNWDNNVSITPTLASVSGPPDGRAIGNLAGGMQSKEMGKRVAIRNLIFQTFFRQIVQGLQDENIEKQGGIKSGRSVLMAFDRFSSALVISIVGRKISQSIASLRADSMLPALSMRSRRVSIDIEKFALKHNAFRKSCFHA